MAAKWIPSRPPNPEIPCPSYARMVYCRGLQRPVRALGQSSMGSRAHPLHGHSSQTDRSPNRGSPLLFLLALIVPLLLGTLLLAACGRSNRSNPAAGGVPAAQEDGPLAQFLPALKSVDADELNGMETAPRYTLDISVDVISRTLKGSGEVVVTNNSREPWNQILFRLYPNLKHYGGDMSVQSVALDGLPANFTYEDSATTLHILLPRPMLPGDQVTVQMAWKLDWPSWVDNNAVYALFGKSQQMVSLPLFYPSLAVYEDGPSVGSGGWWRTMGSVRGDSAFDEISLFNVTARLPSDQVPVTSGTLVLSSSVGVSETQYTWVTGPSREFLLHLSTLFSSAKDEAFGTTITSYWLPGEESAGRAALRYGVSALRVYSDLYGEYPFRDLRIAPAPLGFRGMEYPQAMLLGVDMYDRQRTNLEVLVAHELAHQWWYQVVHNDPVRTPWLDEGIAEYSVKMYLERLQGQTKADFMQYQRWEVPYTQLKSRGSDAPIDQSVESFQNGNQYETVVYGKGALFFDALRADLGDRQFRRFLQTYLAGHRWGIVTDDDFLAALHVLGKPELVELYRDWVTSVQTPAAQAASAAEPAAAAAGN